MAKPKRTTFKDTYRYEDLMDKDWIKIHKTGLEHKSSNTVYFNCPFCGIEVKAYVWSLTGGGKNCQCGALFTGRSGRAYRWKEGIEL